MIRKLFSQMVLGRARLSAVPHRAANNTGFSPWGNLHFPDTVHYEMSYNAQNQDPSTCAPLASSGRASLGMTNQ